MKRNISNLVLIATSILIFVSCQTTEVAKSVPARPTFSVYSGKSDPLMCNVQGEMEDCRADWTVTAGILTHRQVCNSPNRKYIKPMLSAMAKTLSETCELKIKYARLTTKDDEIMEKRLARMMGQSKLWNQYSKDRQQNPKAKSVTEFPEKFIRKVVEVKGVFSEVTEVLNENGYDFGVDKVEVTKLNPLTQSRHFQSLQQIQPQKNLVVPENIRIVWVNKNYIEGRPQRMKLPQDVNSTRALPKNLPQKSTVN